MPSSTAAGYIHGRTGPDEIMVNFLDDRVVSLPPGMVQPASSTTAPPADNGGAQENAAEPAKGASGTPSTTVPADGDAGDAPPAP